MKILPASDSRDVEYRSSVSQYQGQPLSFYKNEKWVPLAFDSIDYINCECVVSHLAILTDGESPELVTTERVCHDGFHAKTSEKIDNSDDFYMEYLPSSDTRDVEYRSTISQYNGQPLTFYKNGQWVPLAFDSLDYIYCDCVVSHRAILTDGTTLNYHFPVCKVRYITDEYMKHDYKEVELTKLDEWFGEGYYNKPVDKYMLINADNGSLGVRNENFLSVGTNYAIASETIEAEDDDDLT